MTSRSLFFILAASLGCAAIKKKQEEPRREASRPPIQDESCARSESEWNNWLEREMRIFRSNSFKINGPHIYSVLDRCAQQIEKIPEFSARTKNLKRFTRRLWLGLQDKHTMGMQRTDDDYFQNTEHIEAFDIPLELKDQEFLRAVDESTPTDQSAAIDWLTTINERLPEAYRFIAFYYRSQHLSTVDDSQAFGRLFVFAPGKNIDKFIQFGVRDNEHKLQPNGVSLISVVKEPSDSAGKRTSNAYYNDLWRLRSANGITFSTRLKQVGKLENCYGCHSSALLPIVPDPTTFDVSKYGKNLEKVSNIMATYSLASHLHMDTEDFGPPMGPVMPDSRTDDFIQKCSPVEDLSTIDFQRVKEAMSCATCHNDRFRRALRYPMAGFQQLAKDSLVKQFVQEFKTMPPGIALTDAERAVVTTCLSKEYLGEDDAPGFLEKWLLGQAANF